MQTAPKKVINSWAMYDWANSAYNLVITSTIFPAYFESVTGDGNDATTDHLSFLGFSFVNTSLYNYALAFAFLIVAIMSPFLSSIADTKGNKKSFLKFFLIMGSIACCSLFFFNKNDGTFGSTLSNTALYVGIIAMVIACLGYWSSLVFYNSYLPEIAAPEDRDRVSARGFAYGYVGSVLLQVICFVFVFMPHIIGGVDEGSRTTTIQFRLSFLLVGIWWLVFGLTALRRLPKGTPSVVQKTKNTFANGYMELRKVWAQLKAIPVLKRYLFAFFFYNMGVQTVMLAAALYGKSELKIPTTNLIASILLIQLVAIPGSIIISRLSNKIGNIKALMCCVIIWIALCGAGYMLPVAADASGVIINKSVYLFYGLATGVGFVMGGIQSLSRSTYAKLMPVTNDTTSFFSFFDVTEKIAIVIGMFSFGYITELTGSQRNSVLALVVYFAIGFVLLAYTLRAKPLTVSSQH